MTEKEYRDEAYGLKVTIFPRGEWQCHICLLPKREMEIFHSAYNFDYLICQPCADKLDREALEYSASKMQEEN